MANLKLGEDVLATLYRHKGLAGLATIMHNVFANGDIIVENEGHCEQETLNCVFDAIERLFRAAEIQAPSMGI